MKNTLLAATALACTFVITGCASLGYSGENFTLEEAKSRATSSQTNPEGYLATSCMNSTPDNTLTLDELAEAKGWICAAVPINKEQKIFEKSYRSTPTYESKVVTVKTETGQYEEVSLDQYDIGLAISKNDSHFSQKHASLLGFMTMQFGDITVYSPSLHNCELAIALDDSTYSESAMTIDGCYFEVSRTDVPRDEWIAGIRQ